MNVLVDTSVWSLALRRAKPSGEHVDFLRELIDSGRAVMIGAIRQEVLSGVRTTRQFESLRHKLRAFIDLPTQSEEYELAAQFYNECRAAGVQGSNTDFLICAAAHLHEAPILTTDRDFVRFAGLLPVPLAAPR